MHALMHAVPFLGEIHMKPLDILYVVGVLVSLCVSITVIAGLFSLLFQPIFAPSGSGVDTDTGDAWVWISVVAMLGTLVYWQLP
jgi:hypothetical protein